MPSFDFLLLPDEIKLMIVLYLPVWDLVRCRRVCKQWNVMITTSTAAQFVTELAIYDMVPCVNKSWTTAAALRRFREQQEGWRQCKWKMKEFIHLQGSCKTYELRNGVWAFGHGEATPEHIDLNRVPPDYTTTITCFKLPSGSDAPEDGMTQWSLNDMGMSIRDFTIDPLVDLIVLVEQIMETREGTQRPFRLHLRRLSDGQPHPMAAEPIIPIKMMPTDPFDCIFDIQLQGIFVGLLIRQHTDFVEDCDYLAIWNWQTGDLELAKKKSSNEVPYDDFTFIDKCSIMLASVEQWATLHVYSFEKSNVYFAGAFELPCTKAEFTYLELHFDGGPSASIAGPGSISGTPYSPTPNQDVLSVTFGVIEARADPAGENFGEASGFTMIMSPKLMLDKLKTKTAGIPKNKMHDKLRVLQWEDWGPLCTRWLPQQLDYLSWQPCLQGGRLVLAALASSALEGEEVQINNNAPSSLQRKQVIRLYDFRSGVISRNLKKGLIEGIELSPSVIPKGIMFEEDIHSRLPYHLVESELLPIPVSGVMIDEGRLVCTRAEEDDDWRQLLVLTF